VSVTPLGPERLTELLEWSCRIVIANETGAEKVVTSGRGSLFFNTKTNRTLTFASWNRIGEWLRRLDTLRQAG
jgi:hypothetical protein